MTFALPTAVALIGLRVSHSLFCSKRSKFSSKRIARSANAFSAVFANLWILRILERSSSPPRARVSSIFLRKASKPSDVVGVFSYVILSGSTTASGVTGTAGLSGFEMSFNTLSGLSGRNPDLDQTDNAFREVNAFASAQHQCPNRITTSKYLL
jgi:hypothetical protein